MKKINKFCSQFDEQNLKLVFPPNAFLFSDQIQIGQSDLLECRNTCRPVLCVCVCVCQTVITSAKITAGVQGRDRFSAFQFSFICLLSSITWPYSITQNGLWSPSLSPTTMLIPGVPFCPLLIRSSFSAPFPLLSPLLMDGWMSRKNNELHMTKHLKCHRKPHTKPRLAVKLISDAYSSGHTSPSSGWERTQSQFREMNRKFSTKRFLDLLLLLSFPKFKCLETQKGV